MSETVHLSEGRDVDMGDAWFELAKPDHFWVKRRFEVFDRLSGDIAAQAENIAEIGCGHGLVQQAFHERYQSDVDGFDLNEIALAQSIATEQPRFVYDVSEKRPELSSKYDLLILFDVIEHLEDDQSFLEDCLFHLRDRGHIAINVPAIPALFSKYDSAAGHHRRYTIKSLQDLMDKVGLKVCAATYWGLPLLPVLVTRNLFVSCFKSEDAVLRAGFKPPSSLANAILGRISKLEPVPQKFLGTSVMVVAEK